MKKKKPKTAGLDYEYRYHAEGFRAICGLDEAGRGAWAGPLYVGAVILPTPSEELLEVLMGVRDSKEMTPRQRMILVDRIKEHAIGYGVGIASVDEINTLKLEAAIRLAMNRAVEALMTTFKGVTPDALFTDSVKWENAPVSCPIERIKAGDKHSLTIAAASVLAKTSRDEQMRTFDADYPDYRFGTHKGYGTAWHLSAIKRYGVIPTLHRNYYKPIRSFLEGTASA